MTLVYQDRIVRIETASSPAAAGHLVVRHPGKVWENLSPEETSHLLLAGTFCAAAVFEHAGAQGTTILASDIGGVHAEVICRKEGDSVKVRWDSQTIPEEEMKTLCARMKDRCDEAVATASVQAGKSGLSSARRPEIAERPYGQGPSSPENILDEKSLEEERDTKKVRNYLLRQLERIP
jgi:diadenosine tetraphosphate (Ap4A) HIT family hydrolase